MTAVDKNTHLSRLFRGTNKRDEKASSKQSQISLDIC